MSLAVSLQSNVEPLDLSGQSVSLNWLKWIKRFKLYLVAAGLEKESDKRKVAILLSLIGQQGLNIFNSFGKDTDTVVFDDLVTLFNDHFFPKKNLTVERHNFLTRRQSQFESIDNFVTDLRNLSLSCELGTLRDSLIKDVFICGLHEDYCRTKDKLLQESDLSLDRAVNICKADRLQRAMHVNQSSHEVFSVAKDHNAFSMDTSRNLTCSSPDHSRFPNPSQDYQFHTQHSPSQQPGSSHSMSWNSQDQAVTKVLELINSLKNNEEPDGEKLFYDKLMVHFQDFTKEVGRVADKDKPKTKTLVSKRRKLKEGTCDKPASKQLRRTPAVDKAGENLAVLDHSNEELMNRVGLLEDIIKTKTRTTPAKPNEKQTAASTALTAFNQYKNSKGKNAKALTKNRRAIKKDETRVSWRDSPTVIASNVMKPGEYRKRIVPKSKRK